VRVFPGLAAEDQPGGERWAIARLNLTTHAGTHLDAPYHFHSTMAGGKRAWTTDEMPLKWCFGRGVQLDFRHLPDGHVVSVAEGEAELTRVAVALQPFDILPVNIAAGARHGQPGYVAPGRGTGREATLFLTERGVRVCGTDAWSWDAPFVHTARRHAETRDAGLIWQGHRAGMGRASCHIEKLAKLDDLPPTGFQVACFPFKIRRLRRLHARGRDLRGLRRPCGAGGIGVQLAGRTVLVTGASKGIGAEIARKLGAEGATVIAHCNTNVAGAQAALAGLPTGRGHVLQADQSEPASMDGLWQRALAIVPRIDCVVLNAAVFVNTGGIEDGMEAWDHAWETQWRVNVAAPTRLMKHAVNHFVAAGGGVLVTMSSWVAQRGSGSQATIAYAASKAAVKAAAQTVARHYAKAGVLSYIVAPGVVRTQMSMDAAAIAGGEEKVTAGLAMGEWVPPGELADLVAFLATGRVRHLSGATLDVNGASYIR
jgi:NAD(P)-dependent dehydrogenase (short-subunit alcohol dehydrogenase family)/kynurenine formamidase